MSFKDSNLINRGLPIIIIMISTCTYKKLDATILKVNSCKETDFSLSPYRVPVEKEDP